MGFFRKIEDEIKDVGRKIDDEIIQPVKENPVALAGLALSIAAPGLGTAIGSALGAGTGAAATALGNAVIGGTLSEAQGGDFLQGALTAGAGSALGGIIRPELASATGSNALASSLTSGAISELSGGDFLQGAVQGGISGLTQDAKLSLSDQYIDAVEPGIGYDPATSPTELDVIAAYPELAPIGDNFSQGVTDILNYAANAPSTQIAAGPNYSGEFSGMEYDPNVGAYRLEIPGNSSGWSDFQWENQGVDEYIDSVEPGIGYEPLTSPTELDVIDAFPELAHSTDLPFFAPIIPMQNAPSAQEVINTIAADVSVANPSLTADEVRSIVEGSISNLPPGLSADDVKAIVTDSISSLPAAPTQQDIIDIIGGQGLASTSQLTQQGQDLMAALQAQGVDYQTSLSQALAAQQSQFGETIAQTTEDLLSKITSSGTDLQSQFESGLQGLADQLGITQQELIDQLSQTQESFGSEISNLQNQFADFDTANAERYADLIRNVGLLGTGLGALQSTFNLFREQNTPKQFEIVAPPSDWASPVYGLPTANNVPFTPSAPIDFGSRELLQGTQFARPSVQATQMPYDLSNMVNTLNYESVPFIQQQPIEPSFSGFANQPVSNVGLNDIIGGLNGQQVSIADIISNIQGQYGQKATS